MKISVVLAFWLHDEMGLIENRKPRILLNSCRWQSKCQRFREECANFYFVILALSLVRPNEPIYFVNEYIERIFSLPV